MKPLTDGEHPTQPVVGLPCGPDFRVGQSDNRSHTPDPAGADPRPPNKPQPNKTLSYWHPRRLICRSGRRPYQRLWFEEPRTHLIVARRLRPEHERPRWARSKTVSNQGGTYMTRKPTHHNQQWTSAEVQRLNALANQNTPTRVIALKLERTENAVRTKASEEQISLKPTNQSPYNRRK